MPEDIGAISLVKAEPRFHARLSCKEKTYVYRIWNSDVPNVFERKYMYAYPEKLDTDEMIKAAKLFIGKHDFSAFSSVKNSKKSTVRTIYDINIHKDGSKLMICLTGDGFLYNMVRIITGTLLEIGAGKRKSDSITKALQSGDRADAGFTAPAKGLVLQKIKY